MEEIIPEIKKEHILELLEKGQRVDGRDFDGYREIKLDTGMIQKAEGSAEVKMGKTRVMVGVKMTLGTPFPDMPDSGVLTTNTELGPIASPEFELGPPDEDSIELARVVDRAIRESECIDLEKLCIEEGEKAWVVFVDIHVLDYDGNLFDASSLGAIAALRNSYIPALDKEKETVDYDNRTDEKLPLVDTPISVTYAKIGDYIVLDTTLEEEEALDARLTIGYNEKGAIVSMQKGGGSGTFTKEEIVDLVKRGREKAQELRGLLE